jgi:predicted HTH transcriptional regulator
MSNPESQHTEWKESWRDEYIKWICGFANAQGGTLYIGKDDRGQVVGLENSRRLLDDISNKVRDLLGILVNVNVRTEGELEYLEIVVEPYPYPVSYKGQYTVPLPERQHQAGTTRSGLRPVPVAKARQALGRRSRTPRFGKRPQSGHL